MWVIAKYCASVILAFALFFAEARAGQALAYGEYFETPTVPCNFKPRFQVISPRSNSLVREDLWLCDTGFYRSLANSSGPDLSQPLFGFDSAQAPGAIFVMDIRPFETFYLAEGSTLNRGMRQLFYARQSLPATPWSQARATLPFAPSSWAQAPSLVLTGLRTVPGQGAKMGPIRYNYGIIAVNAFTFLKPSDFTFLLSRLDAEQRRFGRRYALVTYLAPGDAQGFYVTLLPITPVAQAEPGWGQLTRSADMALFAMDSAGVKLQALGMALTAFAGAYQFYQSSGMAEEERQRCAQWRADGMPGPRPSTLRNC